jgi:hypothetical protein
VRVGQGFLAPTVDSGQELLEHLEGHPLVLVVGVGHVPCPHRAVEGEESGHTVATEVAGPELAWVDTTSRSTCHSDQPMASDLLNL